MPSASLRVNIRNTVDFSKIQKLVDKGEAEILVGFPSGEMHVDTLHKNEEGKYEGYNGEDPQNITPIENAELAKILSFGDANIPARPFLEEGIESKKTEIAQAFQTGLEKVQNGQSANWDKIGQMGVAAIQEFVQSDYYKETAPNSEATIRYKGSDRPLIDGGNLWQSIRYIVNGKQGN